MVPPIIGKSQAIRNIKTLISRVAPTGENILICGETGVGKDLVAQSLYHQSRRVGKPFAKLNCAGLTESLFEIDIPCFEQTDTKEASKKKSQLFNKISGGILYLDKIDLLSPAHQLEILTFLQNDNPQILDLKTPVPIDVCIISSTNQDLEKLISKGKFREGLYYRLSTLRIDIGPLRERPEDIPLLIDFYFKKYASDNIGQKLVDLDKKNIDELCAHHWPGNVRELQNLLKRMMLLEGTEDNFSDLIGIEKNRHTIIEADMPIKMVPHSNGYSDFYSMHASELKSMPLKKAKKKYCRYG